MDTQHDYVLIALMLMLFWVLGVPMFNGLFTLIPRKYRVRIPPPKRYKDKKSPIYKLDKEEYREIYTIRKWELRWINVFEDEKNGLFIWIPLSTLFLYKKYLLLDDTYGKYTKKDIEDGYPELHDIADTYKKYRKEAEKEYKESMEEQDVFENTLKDINSEFLENYE